MAAGDFTTGDCIIWRRIGVARSALNHGGEGAIHLHKHQGRLSYKLRPRNSLESLRLASALQPEVSKTGWLSRFSGACQLVQKAKWACRQQKHEPWPMPASSLMWVLKHTMQTTLWLDSHVRLVWTSTVRSFTHSKTVWHQQLPANASQNRRHLQHITSRFQFYRRAGSFKDFSKLLPYTYTYTHMPYINIS